MNYVSLTTLALTLCIASSNLQAAKLEWTNQKVAGVAFGTGVAGAMVQKKFDALDRISDAVGNHPYLTAIAGLIAVGTFVYSNNSKPVSRSLVHDKF